MSQSSESLGARFRNFRTLAGEAEQVLGSSARLHGEVQVYNSTYDSPIELSFRLWDSENVPAECDAPGGIDISVEERTFSNNGTYEFSTIIGAEGEHDVDLEQNTEYVYCAIGEQDNGTQVTKYSDLSGLQTLIRPNFQEF
ncbi:MAG: hypothetical protein U5L75_03440 [Candidatus Campbellbacteria bacterium]|nr:hypothetical protein [Candidatus Campbellbacteria bacterium]